MATMIPDKPKTINPGSNEDIMFDALRKLPGDYSVIHSFKHLEQYGKHLVTREMDFIIFHPQKGILVLECKGGYPQYINGTWYNGNMNIMEHDGPYNQASSGMYYLRDVIRFSPLGYLLTKCKMMYGVWFCSLPYETVKSRCSAPEANATITLTKEALQDPTPYIEKIFSLDCYYEGKPVCTNLNDEEADKLFRKVLCPEFDLVPTLSEMNTFKKRIFHQLLGEQKRILDYIDDQPTAVINGAAGTGKTWVALEKARRHTEQGEHVLFLCFNKQLQIHLAKLLTGEYAHCYTIDGFACSICHTSTPDYPLLKETLNRMFNTNSFPFPFQHVIIDEGQDFGTDEIENNGIIQLLSDIVTVDEKLRGSCYVFYDRLQLIQGKRIPAYINNADCRLTLTRNCRNTENIGKTSLAPVSEREPKFFDQTQPGVPARISFSSSKDNALIKLNNAVAEAEKNGYSDIVILTCAGKEEYSILADMIEENRKYKGKYTFTTCRKFKGLEADVIILVDVNKDTFNPKEVLLYYVGASRAKMELYIITMLDSSACEELLKKVFKHDENKPIRNAQSKLADEMNAWKF